MAIPGSEMRTLLQPYVDAYALTGEVLAGLDRYLDLLLLWNGRTNLTAVREPAAILQRQIGESLFAAQFVAESGSLMDFGSGAGFPGVPIAIVRPGVEVTLTESQGKKASFLREAVRTLPLTAKVWAGRVEDLPAGAAFNCVTMRAVDDSARMVPVATERIRSGGTLVRFLGEAAAVEISGWASKELVAVPNSKGMLQILQRA